MILYEIKRNVKADKKCQRKYEKYQKKEDFDKLLYGYNGSKLIFFFFGKTSLK